MLISRTHILNRPAAAARRPALWQAGLRLAAVAGISAAAWELIGSNVFATAHGALFSVAGASVAYIVLSVATVFMSGFVSLMVALDKLMLGSLLAAPLAFAQPVDNAGQHKGSYKPRATELQRAFDIGIYGGGNITNNNEIKLRQPGGTNLTLDNVRWNGESTVTEPYWGARATYWSAARPDLGGMFDYTHAKAILDDNQWPIASGTRNGKKVSGKERETETFEQLRFSHGLNFATMNGVARFNYLRRRFAPYVGIGIGIAFPHVYMQRAGRPKSTRTYHHMITGPTFQVLAGIDWRVFVAERITWFTEYKFNYSINTAPLKGGGFLKTNFRTHQPILLGFTFHSALPAATP